MPTAAQSRARLDAKTVSSWADQVCAILLECYWKQVMELFFFELINGFCNSSLMKVSRNRLRSSIQGGHLVRTGDLSPKAKLAVWSNPVISSAGRSNSNAKLPMKIWRRNTGEKWFSQGLVAKTTPFANHTLITEWVTTLARFVAWLHCFVKCV